MVSGNTANDNVGNPANEQPGIGIFVGAGNTISGNTAQNNSQYDLFDINAPGCGSNAWLGNQFKTANATCIN